uniref:DUF148 domain-containing protein n=1 Tax=Meloidogyne hapla TaxID=6305 RepID=A0A1I8BE09_MELHA
MNILKILFLLFLFIFPTESTLVNSRQKALTNFGRIVTRQILNKTKNISTKIGENKLNIKQRNFNFLAKENKIELNKFRQSSFSFFEQNFNNGFIKRIASSSFSTHTGMNYSKGKDNIFDENNLKTLINNSLEEIEIYSKSFFDDYYNTNNSIEKTTQIFSEQNIFGINIFDKLPIPKLSEIDRKNVSNKLFKSFLNEWNKIRKMLEEERIEEAKLALNNSKWEELETVDK